MGNNLISNGYWLIWWYIIVMLPFKVYDFCRKKNKSAKDYIGIIVNAVIAIASIIGFFTSRNDISVIDNNAILILILIAYFQSIIDYFENKIKRNLIFLIIFTAFLLIYFIVV